MTLNGKVVDEEGTALEGAEVEAKWLYLSETQSIKRKYITDQNGYFEINDPDAIGRIIFIEEIELEGYKWIKGGDQSRFNYGDPDISNYYIPKFDGNPTFELFNLDKVSGIYRSKSSIKRMRPVVKSGNLASFPLTENQSLKNIQASPIVIKKGNQNGFYWSLKVEGLNGTKLLRATEDGAIKGAPIAPNEGYTNEIFIEFQENAENWKFSSKFDVYYKTKENTYGKFSLSALPSSHVDKEEMTVSVKYDYNPSGSRVLVYDRAKRVR